MYHYAQKVFDIQLGQTDEAFKDLDNLTCWISWSVYIITWVKPFNMLKIALAYIQAFFFTKYWISFRTSTYCCFCNDWCL